MTEYVVFSLSGFGLVMLVLSALWITCALLGLILGPRSKPAAPKVASPPPAPSPSPVAKGVPAAHVAAITAAVAAVTGGRARVVRVLAPAHGTTDWGQAGRHQLMANRRVRGGWAPIPAVSQKTSLISPTGGSRSS
ncbi:MAG: OadG family transporter subunit [Pseudomonadota bacterium]